MLSLLCGMGLQEPWKRCQIINRIMVRSFLLMLLPVAGIGMIVFSCLLAYNERFFNYWYSDRDFSKEPNKYFMAKYWASTHGVLFGMGLIFVYILYNEKAAKYLIALFS